MLFWTNAHERLLASLPAAVQGETLDAVTVAVMYCCLVEVHIMVLALQRAPIIFQPANLTRYTECLTSPEWLGQYGHRGIAVSRQGSGPWPFWPIAPAAVPATNGHIYQQLLRRESITPAARRAATELGRADQLPDLESQLAYIPVPNLYVVVLLSRHG